MPGPFGLDDGVPAANGGGYGMPFGGGIGPLGPAPKKGGGGPCGSIPFGGYDILFCQFNGGGGPC